MFSGETITLTCEVQGGESTEWTYEWRRSGSVIHSTPSKDWTFIVSESSSGKYTCQCRSRDDWYSSTEWSESIILSVSDKPRATLTAGPTVIPLGGHVILSCSVQTSAGWKYRWFRRTSDTSEVQIGINTKESKEITVRQGGIYRCEGVRGNPDFYTHSSSEVTVEITCEFVDENYQQLNLVIQISTNLTNFCSDANSFQQGCCDSKTKQVSDVQW
uniref:Ig-like domain-containing protein n=1 Tax=Cyprinodon variegatus TaxID=28743 RepID=A0A3Q2GMD3_CYPVA